jgi:hypothetical protein
VGCLLSIIVVVIKNEMNTILSNKSLKPTDTRVTPFAEIAKFAPHYDGLVPPFAPPGGVANARS